MTGTYYERGPRGVRTGPFKLRAATPYRPQLAVDAGPVELTVRRYLDELSVRVPQAGLQYRYAWSERPAAGVGIWSVIGTCGGVVWAQIRRRRVAEAPVPMAEPGVPPLEPESIKPPPATVPPELPAGVSSTRREKHYAGQFYPTEAHAAEHEAE